ncbi:MAG: sugar phosphate isomerase/epimerase [Planctomycetota bacterium]|jgi:sugar phosphate isomerase/epimerase|nr:sugar phosphate isomerase/epimerase [Planctomycetota bacterium]
MKIAGHTMGTPEYSLPEAARLFREIGMDGIEIVVEDGYKSALPQTADLAAAEETAALLADLRLETCCLTPYVSDFNSLDSAKRAKAESDLRIVLQYARILRSPAIRIYGGTLIAGDTGGYDQKLDNLIDSMRRMGDEAAAAGATLALENHFSTMTVSATATAMIVKKIDHPAVGALYDQANLTFGQEEDWQTAMDLQKNLIRHVHVKDLVFKKPGARFVATRVSDVNKEDRAIASRIPGTGVVPWPRILDRLTREEGYEGWLSLEYERRWHPEDIPDASLGMRQGCAYVRGILDTLAMIASAT